MGTAKVATVERVGLRISEVAATIGISRRSLERAIAGGKFLPPDIRVGRMGLWRPATVAEWIDRGGTPR